MSESLVEWFVTRVLIHEKSLMRFLGRSWPTRHELEDIRQEIYIKMFEAGARNLPRLPKAYLFATARHLLIDRVRHQRIVSIEAIGGWAELDNLDVVNDEPSTEGRINAGQDLKQLAAALNHLSPRCSEVLWLRRVEDMSQRDVAHTLGITEGAVEKALARAVSILAKNFEQQNALPATRCDIPSTSACTRNRKLKTLSVPMPKHLGGAHVSKRAAVSV